ncbi:MAG: 2-C-methyl-D-erythritol 4-phosphate cytidylyltransferase [Candidatus Omnitrophica bacterium]|nr:2-C-methyl-D-erythritol 4-phosphate cytidylyltransferase [Candidatus Omnitrophota bacterium]
MTTAIIVAAGKGERLAAGTDKPFLKLNGRPIVSYSLSLFEEITEISSIILVVSGEKMVEASALVSRCGLRKVKEIVVGGAIRQESVWNGLEAIPPNVQTVLIHDAARPLISRDKVVYLITLGKKMATIPVLPVSDTLKEVKGGCVLRTLNRQYFYTVQTPQVFPREVILAAHRQAKRFGMIGTDDAALVEAAGFPVQITEGDRANIKITYPEDLLYAKLILKSMQNAKCKM